LKNIYHRTTSIPKITEAINLLANNRIRAEYHYIVNNPFESDKNRIETLRFVATHHRGPAIFRIFPLQLYPGTPLYDRARQTGLISERHESAYRQTYSGKTRLLGLRYLDIWLRVVLTLRNWHVPRNVLHRLIDIVVHPWTRRVLDRKWFVPAVNGVDITGRFVFRKLIYQPLVRPLRYWCGKRSYAQEHPEDEVTRGRTSITSRGKTPRYLFRRGSRSRVVVPTQPWLTPSLPGVQRGGMSGKRDHGPIQSVVGYHAS
jgi:hypothetical protein